MKKVSSTMSGKVYAKAPNDTCFEKPFYAGELDVNEAIKRYLQSIFGKTLSVYTGQLNRDTIPTTAFIIIQIIIDEVLSTDETRYTSNTIIIKQHSKVTIQLDFYGDANNKAFSMVKKFKTMWLHHSCAEFFTRINFPLAPLNVKDTIVKPFINPEEQYSDRYSIDVYCDFFPEFERCQESAKEIVIDFHITNT